MSIKVLILNTNKTFGGAATAAHRLFDSLCNRDDIEVTYLSLDDLYKGLELKIMRKVLSFLDKRKYLNSPSRSVISSGTVSDIKIKKYIEYINPDIIHIHWINSGFISTELLSTLEKPIVWSLHDMWPFTGGCHYNHTSCHNYYNDCDNCPLLEHKPNLTNGFFNIKQVCYSKINSLTFVGLSRWIHNESQNSSLSEFYNTVNLPNNLNMDIYRKISATQARVSLGVDVDKSKCVIGFGAVGATSDPRKGFLYLKDALRQIDNTRFEVLVFGGDVDPSLDELDLNIHQIGYVSGDDNLVKLYNVLDILILPSVQENLSNMILESLSCEVPVVAFDIGGNSDLIKHKENGYLSSEISAQGILKGVEFVADNRETFDFSSIRKDFSYPVVANKYVELYKSLL